MKGAIELLGSGVGKIFALIAANFPAGSTCTCSDGTKTLSAKNTSGKWLFPIPYAGNWTVSATDGTDSASKVVEIAEGQSVSVTLEYKDYVIHGGVLADGFTINTTTASYEVVDGALVFKSTRASSGNGNIIIDANGQAIDLSNRSSLKFDTEATSPRSGTLDYVRWGVSGTSSVQKNLGVANPVPRQIVPIDISNVSNGSINMFISDNPATVELKIYDAWFE